MTSLTLLKPALTMSICALLYLLSRDEIMQTDESAAYAPAILAGVGAVSEARAIAR
ncbi:MAG: hypothetical protein WBV69_05785 [Candidatus Sulfotelmatobacter sp.]